tara:strand:- start:23 stop:133 length:111 start_codon:yes stop_codon:yes gene_type:complete
MGTIITEYSSSTPDFIKQVGLIALIMAVILFFGKKD